MMRIRDQTGNDTQDREWVDFHVSRSQLDCLFIQSDQAVVFLVHIQIFNHALPNKVREVFQP